MDLAGCYMDQAAAQQALAVVQAALPSTKFVGAAPLPGPCLVALKLANGAVAYADRTGRYFIVGALIDLRTGEGTGGIAPEEADLFSGDIE